MPQSRGACESGKASDEVERSQHDMGRAVAEGLLVAVNDSSAVIDGETFAG